MSFWHFFWKVTIKKNIPSSSFVILVTFHFISFSWALLGIHKSEKVPTPMLPLSICGFFPLVLNLKKVFLFRKKAQHSGCWQRPKERFVFLNFFPRLTCYVVFFTLTNFFKVSIPNSPQKSTYLFWFFFFFIWDVQEVGITIWPFFVHFRGPNWIKWAWF